MFVVPKITEQRAARLLAKKGGRSLLKLKKNIIFPLRTEIVYLPFYVFEVTVKDDEKRQKVRMCVDGLLGHAVFFVKEHMDDEKQSDRSFCDFERSPSEARKALLDEYERLLLEQGLRTRRDLIVEGLSPGNKIFYPFWVGYFKKRKGYDFTALDAVSGEIQGVKMRRVFFRALRQLS